MSKNFSPVVLIIRDGWGCNHNKSEDKYNPLLKADLPFSNYISKNFPRTEIQASGLSVGLPNGIMGNSEVGHQNIGAGRVVDQEIVRIDKSIKSGELFNNKILQNAFENVKKNKSKMHIFGLCSDGGVHSVINHVLGLIDLAKKANVTNVFIHAFTDGRDTPPNSGFDYIRTIEAYCKKIGIGQIASVIGRFWAMDRDNRWERVERAYNCMVGLGTCDESMSALQTIEQFYKSSAGTSQSGDEFIAPTRIVDENGKFAGKIEDGDSVVFFNFRGDRPREITKAFVSDDFSAFKRETKLNIFYSTMTEYEKNLCKNVIFERPAKMKNILGEYVSNLGIKQFRCAETEKYAHVTFFFNDYREEPFIGEDRKLIASPRDISTYDQKPEMSAFNVASAVKDTILSEKYGLVIVNFANPDMVGHTGSFDAAIKAAEVVDKCTQEILSAVDKVHGSAIVTADHGNIELMYDVKNHVPHTQHTTNPVELIVYGSEFNGKKLSDGGALCDISPTLLKMMKLDQPHEMTGKSLII